MDKLNASILIGQGCDPPTKDAILELMYKAAIADELHRVEGDMGGVIDGLRAAYVALVEDDTDVGFHEAEALWCKTYEATWKRETKRDVPDCCGGWPDWMPPRVWPSHLVVQLAQLGAYMDAARDHAFRRYAAAHTKCRCQDCGWTGKVDACQPVKHLAERVAPGEPEPCGECPECGALCQVTEDNEQEGENGKPK